MFVCGSSALFRVAFVWKQGPWADATLPIHIFNHNTFTQIYDDAGVLNHWKKNNNYALSHIGITHIADDTLNPIVGCCVGVLVNYWRRLQNAPSEWFMWSRILQLLTLNDAESAGKLFNVRHPTVWERAKEVSAHNAARYLSTAQQC